MGKSGLLIIAIGLGVALYAYKKQKNAMAAAQPAHTAAAGAANFYQAPGSKLRDADTIFQHLSKAVIAKQLQSFYPSKALHNIADRIAQSGSLANLAALWELPEPFALDLVQLALYDLVILADDSGSMNDGRLQTEMVRIIEDIAAVGAAFDDNGIEIRFLNSPEQGNNVRASKDIVNLFQRARPLGATPIGKSLRDAVLEPLVLSKARQGTLHKPVLVMILTDGAATDLRPEQCTQNVIFKALQDLRTITGLERPPLFFSFGQVGTDRGAIDFLNSLDSDEKIGHCIDVTSAPEVEMRQVLKSLDKDIKNMPPQWKDLKKGIKQDDQLWRTLFRLKRMLGGVDSWYDQTDETSKKRWNFSSSRDIEYRPHWSEQPGREHQIVAENRARGYVFEGSQAVPPSASYPQAAASMGYQAETYGQPLQQVYGQPGADPYGTPAAPQGYGSTPQGYGYPDASFAANQGSAYPAPSNAPYPPANFNSPYPPADANSAPYPLPHSGNPSGGSFQAAPYGAPGNYNSSLPYPPSNFVHAGQAQQSPYPLAPGQGQSPYPVAQGQSPYPPSQPFAGGFNMPSNPLY